MLDPDSDVAMSRLIEKRNKEGHHLERDHGARRVVDAPAVYPRRQLHDPAEQMLSSQEMQRSQAGYFDEHMPTNAGNVRSQLVQQPRLSGGHYLANEMSILDGTAIRHRRNDPVAGSMCQTATVNSR